jgi:hypothetical protein
VSQAIPAWISDITASYDGDENCTKLLQALAIDQNSQPNYSLQNGILRYKGRIYVGSGNDMKSKLFSSFHSSAFGGHSGNRVTHHRLKQLFYWPKFKQFITQEVAECPVCQISKTEKVKYPGLLHPLKIPKMKWTEISLDFIEGLPKSRGKDVILVVVDRLTKYAHFLPLAHPYIVQKVADVFIDNIVKLHGPPSVIISDRDRIFTSKIWGEIFDALKVTLNFSTAYHPETDGQTERVNQCVEQYLRCMAFQEPKKWCDWLPAVELWYNCSYHTTIKMSPFEALYEYPPPLIQELTIPCNATAETQVTLLEKDHMIKSLQQNMLQAQQRMKKYADMNRTERSFDIGEMVYLKMQPYRETALGLRNSLKLTSKWYGSFKIIKKVGKLAYQLQLPAGTRLHDVFHGKVKTAPLAVLQRRQIPRNAGGYDVAVPQWLVHWENMATEDATWEDAAFIQATFPAFKP